MRKNNHRGYAGILSILVVAVLIAWIVWMRRGGSDVMPQLPQDTPPREGQTTSSYVETNLRALDKARDAKEAIERGQNQIEEGF